MGFRISLVFSKICCSPCQKALTFRVKNTNCVGIFVNPSCFLPDTINNMSIITVKFVFWIGLLLVFYTFIGYGLLLYLLTIRNQKKLFGVLSKEKLPSVTFVIPAYNEDQWIVLKLSLIHI